MRNFKSGYGTRFIVISFKSIFKTPSNRIEQVKLLRTWAIILFILSKGFSWLFYYCPPPVSVTLLPYFIKSSKSSFLFTWTLSFNSFVLLGLSVKLQMFISAWLSIGKTQSTCFYNSWSAKKLLYGDVTTSSSFYGKTEEENL